MFQAFIQCSNMHSFVMVNMFVTTSLTLFTLLFNIKSAIEPPALAIGPLV